MGKQTAGRIGIVDNEDQTFRIRRRTLDLQGRTGIATLMAKLRRNESRRLKKPD